MLIFYLQPSFAYNSNFCSALTIKFFADFSINCTFDFGMCGFFQVHMDDFDWIWSNQSTPTVGTGPDRDHTSGTGYYVYIETSPPRKPGDVADLSSGLQVESPMFYVIKDAFTIFLVHFFPCYYKSCCQHIFRINMPIQAVLDLRRCSIPM